MRETGGKYDSVSVLGFNEHPDNSAVHVHIKVIPFLLIFAKQLEHRYCAWLC